MDPDSSESCSAPYDEIKPLSVSVPPAVPPFHHHSQHQQMPRSNHLGSDPPMRSTRRSRVTDDTSSDIHSAFSSDGAYEVIEYDFPFEGDGSSSDFFPDMGRLRIQEDSPAAAALRANAGVHVSSVSKVARAVHMQSVRRVLKRAAGKSKSGNIRGKPPRVPPKLVASPLAVFREDPSDEVDEDDDKEEDDKAYMDKSDQKSPAAVQSDHSSAPPSTEFAELYERSKSYPTTQKESDTPLDRDTMHIPDGVAPGTVEAGKKVLRSVDPHDLLKLVRWKRKKKGEVKKNKSYVKGKVIDGEHELYTLSIAVMIGVRTSISRTNTVLHSLLPRKRFVSITDFRATEKYEFHPKGDGPLPAHQLAHTFKFKDYCPLVFAYLRRMHGVNEYDFLLSVCANANFIEFISNAKSGQFFFYSGDGRYMIKTMTNAESKHFRRILPDYFKHCCENPNTLITRFFGMYRVKLYHLRRNVKFVIMNSVYYTDKHLQTFFDLKGSTAGRDAKPGQAVLKDNDLRRGLPDQALALRLEQRKHVRDQVESDCNFLKNMGVMDYSMLVGIHHVPPFEGRSSMTIRKNKVTRPRKNTAQSFTGGDESESNGADIVASFKKGKGMGHRRNASSSVNGADDSEVSDYDPIVQESSVSSSVAEVASPRTHRRTLSAGQSRVRSDTLGSFVTHSFEDGSDDDENSYLMGSTNRPASNQTYHEEREMQKRATEEKLFWPFHHLFDIYGHRRHQPARCVTCQSAPCSCIDTDSKLLVAYNIPKFVAPLSDRKDGGFEMDTTGLQLPIKTKLQGGEMVYEGKIFYMGIIDILQEYGSRKEFESFYRMMRTTDRLASSCVPPKDYGQRFLEFFDKYTRRVPESKDDKGAEYSVRI